MKCLVCVIFVILLSAVIYAEERPLVSIEDGLVRGTHKTSYHGRKYAAFEGIPYAQPPIQSLRFRDPQPVIPWQGVLDANSYYKCLQLQLQGMRVAGQEDCLYLNVYVPQEKLQSNEKLDVIVHVHGAGFMLGDPNDMSGPSKLMDRDVVYVNFNYRLGPLGFYSTGDSILPGNYGLKDQVFVLQWIQKNIEKFGGNPDSVTLTGSSAGGASVHLHYFSLLSEGLFHKGWVSSGSALNPWVIKDDPSLNAKILAKEVGCQSDSVPQLLGCLRERSALQIQEAVKATYKDWLVPLSPFGPTIEPFAATSFLTAHPYSLLVSNVVANVPVMFVATTGEGLLPSIVYYERLSELNEKYELLFPFMLEYSSYNQTFQEDITEKISDYYFEYDPLEQANFEKLVKLCSQRLYDNGIEKSIKLQSKITTSDVFFMRMGTGSLIPGLEHLGVPHAGDTIFYYDIVLNNTTLSTREVKMKDVLIDMMVNFASTGKPAVRDISFKPNVENNELQYLLVKGPDDIKMKHGETLGGLTFWDSLGLNEDQNLYSGDINYNSNT
ncbi:Est-6 [Trypoxylus dichotomus]